MEGLVNYSSEDEQDDYSYTKVAVRERGSGGASTGRTADASGSLKRSYDHHSKGGSCERDSSPHRTNKGDHQQQRFKPGNGNFNEDKYKIDRRADKSRDHRDKRDSKDSRNTRDVRDEGREYEHNHKYDYKKHDDHKRYREPKGRDYKRDGNDYYRDDKRYNRYDERKSSYANSNYKDRFNNSKSRYDERKQYDDHRFNDERRTATNEERRGGGGGGSSGSGGSNFDDRRRGDFNERRNYNNNDDDRKSDRRNNDDRRTQRSYNEDRSNAYRPRRSNSPALSQRNSSNSNNKYSDRKEDTRRERKRHSRSRSRSRSHSADNLNESNLAANNNSQQRTSANELATEVKRPEGVESQAAEKRTLPTARNFEALLSLPLSENAPKHPNVVTVPAVSAAAAAGSNAAATATVQLPSYYNPNVINPNKYVEQMQKRKLIWGAKKSEDSASKWGHAQFSQDQDGKVASKFMRLMGIKSSGGDCSTTSPNDSEKKSPTSSTSPTNNTDVKSREAMFSSMEQQYEVARQVTHTMRGVGLGFSSQSRPY